MTGRAQFSDNEVRECSSASAVMFWFYLHFIQCSNVCLEWRLLLKIKHQISVRGAKRSFINSFHFILKSNGDVWLNALFCVYALFSLCLTLSFLSCFPSHLCIPSFFLSPHFVFSISSSPLLLSGDTWLPRPLFFERAWRRAWAWPSLMLGQRRGSRPSCPWRDRRSPTATAHCSVRTKLKSRVPICWRGVQKIWTESLFHWKGCGSFFCCCICR